MNTITGLPELLNKFKDLSTQGERLASAIVNSTADQIVAQAKENAPADLGKIRQGIVKEQISAFQVSIAATAPESVFQEFGTGGKVDVPSEMADVASSFQGESGGGMADFILALVGWISRHGITGTKNETPEQIAWAMAKAILRDGLRPQPFLYPAFVQFSVKLVPTLQVGLQELLKSKQA
jgi:HK97 gp10 family phage protein